MHSNGATKWHKKGLCSTLRRTIKVQAELKKEERKKVKSLSRVRLCNPMDCSLPGSSVHGIFQARVLEWGAIKGNNKLRSETLEKAYAWEGTRHVDFCLH